MELQSQAPLLPAAAAVEEGKMRQGMAGELVVVTGATGRTGIEIVGMLLKLGCRVRVFSRTEQRIKEKLAGLEGFETCLGDVAKAEDVIKSLEPAADGTKVSRILYAAGGEKVVYKDVNGVAPQLFAKEGSTRGVKQMILVSAGWVSKPSSIAAVMFNTIETGCPMGWHLKGEDGMRRTAMDIVIVRAGRLIDEKAAPPVGIRIGQGDNFGFLEGGNPGMTTGQLAEVCVQALKHCDGKRITFEVIGDKKTADCRSASYDWAGEFAKLEDDVPFVEPAEDPIDTHMRAARNAKLSCCGCFGVMVLLVIGGMILALS